MLEEAGEVDKILTSLVITTYNRAALLGKALESVAQSRIDDHERVEVIVVDNNSTDHTRQIVEEIGMNGFPFSLHYVLEPRQGVSYARNRGADEATGTYVAYMDSDQLIEQHYLSRIVSIFRDTRAACVGGPVLYYNKGELPNWVSPLIENAGQTWYGDETRVLGPTDGMLQGGNMVLDRSELMNIGKFDTNLGRTGNSLLGGEEDDLQERLHAAGKKVVYDPGLVQHHYLAPARLTKRYWRQHKFDYGRTCYRRKLSKGKVPEPVLFGAPRWLWRHLLTKDIPRALRPLLRLDATEGFYKQLDVWTRLGEIHEARQTSRTKA